jgi:hypothetical protein
MAEDHIMRIRNGCTLEQMTKMQLPTSRFDPIKKQMMPNFYYSSSKSSISTKADPYPNENIKITEIKSLPSDHYIETRFYPYSKAKITNKPIISQLSKNIDFEYAQLSNRSQTESKFRTSKYPKVPLSKELIKKVEDFNNFKELQKKPSKKTTNIRPFTPVFITKKSVKAKISSLQSWEKLKNEKEDRRSASKTVRERNYYKTNDKNDLDSATLSCRPNSENIENNKNNLLKKRMEFVSTIESISSNVSPMAPVYAAKMIPQSPNFVIFPYTRYNHLFE